MDNEKMGRFIALLRKQKNMTQKELANQLNITDKAVSKWERGLSCPDISILSKLSGLLGVSTGELLNGERSEEGTGNVETVVENTLEYADKASRIRFKNIRTACTAALSGVFLCGILVCVICDLAISGSFTWSLYPISSIILAWFLIVPIIQWGQKGIFISLALLSILIFPFLFLLSGVIGNQELLLPIGIRSSLISLIYLWIVYAVFFGWKIRKWLAAAICVMLAVPEAVVINLTVSRLLGEPRMDIWDLLTYLFLAATAALLFVLDKAVLRKRGGVNRG